MRDRAREDRVGQFRGRTTTPRERAHRTSVRRGPSHPLRDSVIDLVPFRTYTSVDPAPPTSGLLAGRAGSVTDSSVEELRSKLLDTRLPLFERYRAMFALRNIGTPAAVDALAAGFSDDSALFK